LRSYWSDPLVTMTPFDVAQGAIGSVWPHGYPRSIRQHGPLPSHCHSRSMREGEGRQGRHAMLFKYCGFCRAIELFTVTVRSNFRLSCRAGFRERPAGLLRPCRWPRRTRAWIGSGGIRAARYRGRTGERPPPSPAMGLLICRVRRTTSRSQRCARCEAASTRASSRVDMVVSK